MPAAYPNTSGGTPSSLGPTSPTDGPRVSQSNIGGRGRGGGGSSRGRCRRSVREAWRSPGSPAATSGCRRTPRSRRPGRDRIPRCGARPALGAGRGPGATRRGWPVLAVISRMEETLAGSRAACSSLAGPTTAGRPVGRPLAGATARACEAHSAAEVRSICPNRASMTKASWAMGESGSAVSMARGSARGRPRREVPTSDSVLT